MNRIFYFVVVAWLCLQNAYCNAQADGNGIGAGLQVGTLGAGISLVKSIVPTRLSGEIDLNAPLQHSYNVSIDNTNYHGSLRAEAFGALLNVFPFENHLMHVTVGGYLNENRINLGAEFGSAFRTLNGQAYTSSQLTELRSRVTFKPFAPYAGIGWGDSTKSAGWHFLCNAGALYQGSARVNLVGKTPYIMGGPQYNALFANLESERQIVVRELSSRLQWYPVLTLGLSYQF